MAKPLIMEGPYETAKSLSIFPPKSVLEAIARYRACRSTPREERKRRVSDFLRSGLMLAVGEVLAGNPLAEVLHATPPYHPTTLRLMPEQLQRLNTCIDFLQTKPCFKKIGRQDLIRELFCLGVAKFLREGAFGGEEYLASRLPLRNEFRLQFSEAERAKVDAYLAIVNSNAVGAGVVLTREDAVHHALEAWRPILDAAKV